MIQKVYGGPGAGKTTHLVKLISDIVEKQGIDINRILGVSFTRKGAEELASRVGVQGKEHFFRTLHSTCYRLNRIKKENMMSEDKIGSFAKKYHYAVPDRFKVKGEDDATATMYDPLDVLMGEIGASQPNFFYFNSFYDRARSLCQTFEQAYTGDMRLKDDFLLFAHRIEEFKKEYDLVDFHDILSMTVKNKLVPDVDYYIHDEYQDTTPLQEQVAKLWRSKIPEVIVAGDDDQAIFTYAGADPAFMNNIQGKETVLQQGNRNSEAIHSLAQSIITLNTNRKQKIFHAAKPGGYIEKASIHKIKDLIKQYRDKTIKFLFRENWTIGRAAEELRELGLEVNPSKKILAALQTFLEPELSFDYEKLDSIANSSYFPSKEYFEKGFKTKLKSEIDNLTFIQAELSSRGDSICFSEKDLRSMGAKDKFFEDIENKDISSLKLESGTVRNYIKVIDTFGFNPPKIELSTIHRAKGSEAQVVFLFRDISKRTWQNEKDDREAERRVIYTGVTRAFDRLILVDRAFGGYETTLLGS